MWQEPRVRVVAAVLAALAVFAAGYGYARTGGSANPPAELVVEEAAGEEAGGDEGEIFVHVVGAVEAPGVQRLPAGSRVFQALERSRPLADADLSALNLAQELADGSKLVVPRAGETPADGEEGGAAGVTVPAASAGDTRLNLNAASAAELDEALPGIGPELARRIVAYRQQHGPFASVEQVQEVPGIGEKRFQQLRELVCVR